MTDNIKSFQSKADRLAAEEAETVEQIGKRMREVLDANPTSVVLIAEMADGALSIVFRGQSRLESIALCEIGKHLLVTNRNVSP